MLKVRHGRPTRVDISLTYLLSTLTHSLIRAYLSLTVPWLVDSQTVHASSSTAWFHSLWTERLGKAWSKRRWPSMKEMAFRMTSLSSYGWMPSLMSFDLGDIMMFVYSGQPEGLDPTKAELSITCKTNHQGDGHEHKDKYCILLRIHDGAIAIPKGFLVSSVNTQWASMNSRPFLITAGASRAVGEFVSSIIIRDNNGISLDDESGRGNCSTCTWRRDIFFVCPESLLRQLWVHGGENW